VFIIKRNKVCRYTTTGTKDYFWKKFSKFFQKKNLGKFGKMRKIFWKTFGKIGQKFSKNSP